MPLHICCGTFVKTKSFCFHFRCDYSFPTKYSRLYQTLRERERTYIKYQSSKNVQAMQSDDSAYFFAHITRKLETKFKIFAYICYFICNLTTHEKSHKVFILPIKLLYIGSSVCPVPIMGNCTN